MQLHVLIFKSYFTLLVLNHFLLLCHLSLRSSCFAVRIEEKHLSFLLHKIVKKSGTKDLTLFWGTSIIYVGRGEELPKYSSKRYQTWQTSSRISDFEGQEENLHNVSSFCREKFTDFSYERL